MKNDQLLESFNNQKLTLKQSKNITGGANPIVSYEDIDCSGSGEDNTGTYTYTDWKDGSDDHCTDSRD